MRLRAHGIAADLPLGWEGGIRSETAEQAVGGARTFGADTRAPTAHPVAHFATFPLPAERGDFGGDVVPLMTTSDAFVALLEYGPDEVGSALFAKQGLPLRLDPRAFHRGGLHRTLPGHAGYQEFFTEGGRAFCLYVVLGDADDTHRLVRQVEQVLATIDIEPHA